MANAAQLTSLIRQKAHELGYVLCGITDASPFNEFLTALDKRIQRYPESADLYHNLRKNAYPKKHAEWAQSVIVGISRYGKYRIPEGLDRYFGKYYLTDGRLRYAAESHAFDAFRTFLEELGLRVATPRLATRWAAVRAGLARFGNNNFLYTPYGSWVVSKLWVVDKVLDYDTPQPLALCPKNCTRCIDACPTQALEEPFMMDYGRCIAHLSYNLTTLMPEHLREQMGTWIYGCDVCQNACPLNKGKWELEEDFPKLDRLADYLTLPSLLRMTQKVYERVVQPRFWYMDKEALWIWKSHALRAMVNSGDEYYHALIREACSDPHESVRQMAEWASQHIR